MVGLFLNLYYFCILEVYSKPCQASRTKVLNVFQPLSTSTKGPILDVWQDSEYTSVFQTEKWFPSRKPRSKLTGKILMLLCTSLILLLIVFLIGIEKTSNKENCRTVAALLHYFILTTFMWMGVEAANLYQMFVKIFQTQTRSQKRFLVRASIIAWGR